MSHMTVLTSLTDGTLSVMLSKIPGQGHHLIRKRHSRTSPSHSYREAEIAGLNSTGTRRNLGNGHGLCSRSGINLQNLAHHGNPRSGGTGPTYSGRQMLGWESWHVWKWRNLSRGWAPRPCRAGVDLRLCTYYFPNADPKWYTGVVAKV